MTDVIFAILLTIHVGAVVGWMGSSLVFSQVVGPSIATLKPDSRSDFLLNALPKFSRFVSISASVAIIFGIILAGYVFGANTSLLPTGIGLFFLLGGSVLGFVALLIAVSLMVPMSNRILKTLQAMREQKGTGSIPQIEMIRFIDAQKNIQSGGRAISVLLAIVLILMVTSFYV